MLIAAVERYVALHRATGFKFKIQACLLHHFVRYATSRDEITVRADTAIAWAAEAPSPRSRTARLQVVRRFARVAAAEDSCHEIPPPIDYGPRNPRRPPHIFSVADVARVLGAAAALGPAGTLFPQTLATLIAVLVATGLRISEALTLQLADVTTAGLVVRETKFRKSRLVPVDETVRRGIDRYLKARTRTAPIASTVFVSSRGAALPYSTVNAAFLALVRSLGLHPGPGREGGPRIHDFRHTFAVRSLEQCEGNGESVRRHMVALSTYLGHAHFSDTYWYQHATPRLLADIASAAEDYTSRESS